MNDDELLNRYMAHAESVGHGTREANEELGLESAEDLDRLVRDAPERAWPLIQGAIQRSSSDHVLAFVAAGPLEDLVRLHLGQFVDRIEAVAAADERCRRALSGVWVHDLPVDLEIRLARIIGPGPHL